MREYIGKNFISLLRAFLILLLVGLLILVAYTQEWTGFGTRSLPGQDQAPAKTLWDWLELLIIPAALAAAVILLNRSERRAERESMLHRDKTERELSEEGLREAALQSYIDRITELMLERGFGLSDGKPTSDFTGIRAVARARTLTTLRSLDGRRRGLLLRFLHDSALIGTNGEEKEALINLHGAGLSEATLRGADLSWADLRGADLLGSDLSWADLRGCDLSGAYLSGADLSGADLSGADLRSAVLRGADLNGANLRGADLTGADLRAAILRGADLSWSHLIRGSVTKDQLAQARSLRGATMPDGTKHD